MALGGLRLKPAQIGLGGQDNLLEGPIAGTTLEKVNKSLDRHAGTSLEPGFFDYSRFKCRSLQIQVARYKVHLYDPACSQPPAPRWRELHAATRRAFLAEIAQIGVSHKAVRLRLLERMAHDAIANHYPDTAAALLEQAAKECGGIYERKPASRDSGAAASEP